MPRFTDEQLDRPVRQVNARERAAGMDNSMIRTNRQARRGATVFGGVQGALIGGAAGTVIAGPKVGAAAATGNALLGAGVARASANRKIRQRVGVEKSLRQAYRAAKQIPVDAQEATESATRSAKKVEQLVPDRRQAAMLAGGAAGAIAVGTGAGTYVGTKRGTVAGNKKVERMRVKRAESMQTVGKRRDWETIDDMQYRERAGNRRRRNGRKVAAAGAGLTSLAVRSAAGTKPGLPQEIRNISTGFRDASSLRAPGEIARGLGQTLVRNPYGAATVIGAATVATGLGVRGVGARQARSARGDMRARRKELAARRGRRDQDVLVVRKNLDLYPRFGAGGAVGRRIVDPYEPMGEIAKGLLVSRSQKAGKKAMDLHNAAGERARTAADTRYPARVANHTGQKGSATRPGHATERPLPNWFGKADRRFDPEARRRHNQGMVTGAAGVGAGAMGASAYRDLKRSNSIAEGKRGVFVTARSGAKVAGTAGLGLVAVRNYRKANGQRNRRYT